MRLREPRTRLPKAVSQPDPWSPDPCHLLPPETAWCLSGRGEGNRKPCSVIHALASPMKPRKVRILATSAHRMDGKSKATSGSVSVSMLCSNSNHNSPSPSGESPAFQLRVHGPVRVGREPSFLLCLIFSHPLPLILVGFPIVTVDTLRTH